jgi:2-iminoacetate synthase ThiH
MAATAEPTLEELLWTVAMARIILGADANVQVTSLMSL